MFACFLGAQRLLPKSLVFNGVYCLCIFVTMAISLISLAQWNFQTPVTPLELHNKNIYIRQFVFFYICSLCFLDSSRTKSALWTIWFRKPNVCFQRILAFKFSTFSAINFIPSIIFFLRLTYSSRLLHFY